MAANPNPARITDEIWWLWEAFKAHEPTVQLGGIYAAKPGYHGTRDENKVLDYSVRDPQDQLGPGDKAAAIDLTFPDAFSGRYDTIDLYSSRLLASGQDPADPRGDYLREFYGQADGDLVVEGWDFRYLRTVTSDSSHLWHIHISISREHVANAAAMRALLSILRGETVEQWQSNEEDSMGGFFGAKGPNGEDYGGQREETLAFRVDALHRNLPAVAEGQTKGERNELHFVLKDLADRIAKLETGGIDPAVFKAAVIEALKDPAGQAALVAAANKAEDQ